MRCQEFEGMVVELACGRGLDESGQREAAAHAAECARCASRLAAERELTVVLGACARSVAAREAPARVEAALLDAFDRQGAARFMRRPIAMPPRRWAFAAAAMVAAMAAAVWLAWPSRVVAPAVAVARPVTASALPRIEPPPIAVQPVVRQARPRPRRPARREIATRFYPLAPAEGFAEIQGAPIVRVGLPRSALASFGWPLDPDQQAGSVQADVLLDSETGMARAIRFVDSRP